MDSAQGSNALGFFLGPSRPADATYDAAPQNDGRRRQEWPPRKPAHAPPGAPGRLSLSDYLQKILTARVYDVAIETPLDPARSLSKRLGNQVLLKREDTQPVFSFKLRGAYNKMAHLSAEQLAARRDLRLGRQPRPGRGAGRQTPGLQGHDRDAGDDPAAQDRRRQSHGGEVVLHGDSYSDAYGRALELQAEHGLTFVHPFDDPDVIAGQGTIAMEILRQHQGPIDAVFVAIGGGGLISGVAAYIKAVRPEIKVIGVQTVDSDAMLRSVRAGKRVHAERRRPVRRRHGRQAGRRRNLPPGARAGRRLRRRRHRRGLRRDQGRVPGHPQHPRAVGRARRGRDQAVRRDRTSCKGQTFVAITCGANMNFDRLRFVAERAEVGEHREALFAVTIPEERGSFKRFCELLGPRSVTEFNYRISDSNQAHVFVGVATVNEDETDKLARSFERHGFATLDLTDDELAKEHVRHMVGGRSSLANDERLYRFVFPERPGALMRFLSSMHPDWNISLFHYRNQGADYGRILVGVQVPKADKKAFRDFLEGLAYPCEDETDNPVYRLFLR